MKDITIVIGASGGLGRAVASHFDDCSDWSLNTGVDLRSHASVVEAAKRVAHAGCTVHRVINCAGVNTIVPLDELTWEAFVETMRVNAWGFVNVIKELRAAKVIADGAVLCNVISNAARVPMTHSCAYNASKAAQEMMTRQLAREFKQYSVFGVNPNKLEGTPMSLAIEADVLKLRGWTAEEAKRYQLAALPAGVETPVESLASFIAEMMKPIHHPYITGCIMPYGGPVQ